MCNEIKLSLTFMELIEISEIYYHLADEYQPGMVKSVTAIHKQSME